MLWYHIQNLNKGNKFNLPYNTIIFVILQRRIAVTVTQYPNVYKQEANIIVSWALTVMWMMLIITCNSSYEELNVFSLEY